MAWIESHETLRHHPKTRKFARHLGVSLVAGIGHLHCLWWWCLSYAQDGNLSQHDTEDIAEGAAWEGDPNELIMALLTSGFADDVGGDIILHDWHDYAGKLVDRRVRNREAMRKARGQPKDDTTPTQDDTEQTRVQHVYNTCTTRDATCKATVPNPTVPNSTKNLEGATDTEKAILAEFGGVKGYPLDAKIDLPHIRKLAADFPLIDLLREAKAWATYKLDRPLEAKSNPRSQFRTWCSRAKPAPTPLPARKSRSGYDYLAEITGEAVGEGVQR